MDESLKEAHFERKGANEICNAGSLKFEPLSLWDVIL
jgi:hypothetical protein